MNHKEFIEQLTNKVMQEKSVSLVLLVGSFARGDYKPSSDIDLMIVTEQRETFLQNDDFYTQFGHVDDKQLEYYGECTSVRVFYSSGIEVEFGFVDNTWLSTPLDKGTIAVLTDGYIVLYDRDQIFKRIEKEIDFSIVGKTLK